MPQIDTSIYQNVGRPSVQLQDPSEIQGRALQLKSLLGQQQAQQMQLEQAQRAQEQERTLGELYKTSVNPDGSVNRQQILQGAAQRGLGTRIPGLQKGFADADKATADVAHTKAQTGEIDFKVMKQKMDVASGAINSLLANPGVNNDMVISTLTNLVQQGIMPPEQGAQIARSLPGNPAMLRQFLMQQGLQAMDASKRMDLLIPKTDIKDTGSALIPVQTNQLTGETTTGAPVAQKTVTPGEQLSAETQRRGQNMVDARAKSAQEDGKWQYDSARGGLVNIKTGQFKPATTADGTPVGEKGVGDRKKDANDAISLIDEAAKLLDGATGSYGGKAVDMTAQVFGAVTPGAKKAARLKALEGMLVSKMPKMSGPQSDKDVAMYKQMAAAVGDDTIPAETRRAALDTVREIQERYAGMPSRPTGTPQSHSGTVTPAKNITVEY